MVYPRVKTEVQLPSGIPNGTLFVNVSRTFGNHIRSKVIGELVSIEDCVRGYWTNQNLSQAHANECEWLMAHSGGVIEGVWKIDREYGFVPAQKEKKETFPDDELHHDSHCSICRLVSVDAVTSQKFIGQEVHLGRAFNPLRGYFKD